MRPRLTLAASLAVASGCRNEPPTQLVVVVDSDLDLDVEIDAFRVRVLGPDGDERHRSVHTTAEFELPATFGVRPEGGDPARRVTIEATAILAGEDLFSTRAVTSFVGGQVSRLDLFLAARCRTLACRPEETCRRDGCGTPEVDVGDLAPWTGLDAGADAAPPDAGLDAAAPLDASLDAGTGPDAATDPPVVAPTWLMRSNALAAHSIVVTPEAIFAAGSCDPPCATDQEDSVGTPGETLAWITRQSRDGTIEWTKVFAAPGGDLFTVTMVGDDEALWLAGVTTNGGTVCGEESPGLDQSFVARVDAVEGICTGAVFTGNAGPNELHDLVVVDGRPLVVGEIATSYVLQGAVFDVVPAAHEPFALGVDMVGVPASAWCSADVPATADTSALFWDVVPEDADRVALAGMVRYGSIDLGLDPLIVDDRQLVFAARARRDDCTLEVAGILESDSIVAPPSIAAGRDGALLPFGSTAGTVSLGGTDVVGGGGADLTLARFGGAGDRLRVLGNDAQEVAKSLVVLDDRTVVGGWVGGASDLDGVPLGGAGQTVGFVLVLDEGLATERLVVFTAPSIVAVVALAADEAIGKLVVLGAANGDLDRDGERLLDLDPAFLQGAFVAEIDLR